MCDINTCVHNIPNTCIVFIKLIIIDNVMLVFGKSQAFLCVPTYLLTKLALFYIQRFILFEKVYNITYMQVVPNPVLNCFFRNAICIKFKTLDVRTKKLFYNQGACYRETPTSAGPNSFGKTKQGFCDAKKVFEKNLKHALETVEGRKGTPKYPQTIYKINSGSN